MKDVQNLKDHRGLDINEVGITNFKVPIIFGLGKNKQQVVSSVKMGVNLLSDYKGTHMSRFAEIIETIKGSCLDKDSLFGILKNIKKNLQSDYAKTEFLFSYFVNKKAPVSGRSGIIDYQYEVGGEIDKNDKILYFCEVAVPIATLCPCSKEISENNAHNQRAIINLRVKSDSYITIEELIEAVESNSSCELYSTLKRVDEKHVTEKMYNNPKFVEDIVRDIALWARENKKINDYIVKCKSYESIHNHNAYAIIIHNKNASN